MHKLYVGIDVHKREQKVAVLPLTLVERTGNAWQKVKPISIRNNISDFALLDTIIRSHICNSHEVLIAVDHTGGHYSEPIVSFLQSKGYPTYYLEAKATRAARERFLDKESKSDVIDSTSAAYLLYLRDLHGLSFRISATPSALGSEAAALNSLALQRWQFIKLANQATNRLRQFLLAVFPEGECHYFRQLTKILQHYPTPHDILANRSLRKIKPLSQKERKAIVELATKTVGIHSDVYRWLIRDLSLQRNEALAKRDELTSMLRDLVTKHPYGHILLSFPYLGEVAAATIIGVIKNIERWPDKKKFKKALGVYNRYTQSGMGSSRAKQGREGNRQGRRVLFLVCVCCITRRSPDNDFKDYYVRQVAGGKPKMKALVSTMGKLAEIIYHCLKAGEPYEYQGRYRISVSIRESVRAVTPAEPEAKAAHD